MKKIFLLLFFATKLFSQTTPWIEPRANHEGRLGSESYYFGAGFFDTLHTAIEFDTAQAKSQSRTVGLTGIIVTSAGKTYFVALDTTLSATYYKNGFIKKSGIDSVGNLVKGSLGAGFTVIDSSLVNMRLINLSNGVFGVLDSSKILMRLMNINTGTFGILDTAKSNSVAEITTDGTLTATRYNGKDFQLKLPQSVATSFSPTFAGATFNGALAMGTNAITSVGAITSSGNIKQSVPNSSTLTIENTNTPDNAQINFKNTTTNFLVGTSISLASNGFEVYDLTNNKQCFLIAPFTGNAIFAGSDSILHRLSVGDSTNAGLLLRVGTTGGASSYINAGDAAWTVTSDTAMKKNITPFTVNLKNFNKVKPIHYNFKENIFAETFNETSVPDSVFIDIKKPTKKKIRNQQIDSVYLKTGKISIADSVLVNDTILVQKKISNKVAKDSLRNLFIANNLQKQKTMSEIPHTGFSAQEFGSQFKGKPQTEINYNDVIAVMWLKIQDLQNQIDTLKINNNLK